MQFRVRLFEPADGSIREELVEAASRAALDERYAAGPAVLLSAARAGRGDGGARADAAAAARGTGLGQGRGAGLDIAWWCRELRTLLVAGMTVVEAIETLHAQAAATHGSGRAQVHGALLERLREGQALSVAMQSAGGFPPVLIAGVKASERTSNLVEALDDFLHYHAMLETLRKQVIAAAIYPGVVIGLGTLITLFLLLFVVPRFSKIYTGMHGGVGTITELLLGLSRLLAGHGQAVALALAGLAALLVLAWRSGAIARAAQRLAASIAPLQRQIDEFRLAKLYHSLALMFRGGYALDDALRQCAGLGLGAGIAERVTAAQAALMRGQRVSAALGDAGLTDTVTRRLLAVGERTGNFDRVLQTIAERHALNFSTFVERATRVVEPLLLLIVALLVGGLVVMMYMPIFDIATSVQ